MFVGGACVHMCACVLACKAAIYPASGTTSISVTFLECTASKSTLGAWGASCLLTPLPVGVLSLKAGSQGPASPPVSTASPGKGRKGTPRTRDCLEWPAGKAPGHGAVPL